MQSSTIQSNTKKQYNSRPDKIIQHKTIQDGITQDQTIQYNTRQHNITIDKTRQDTTIHDNTI